MTSGEPEITHAHSCPFTLRSKVGGRRVWVGFALVAIVVGGVIAYLIQHQSTTRVLFDPFAAAAKSSMYSSHPPVGDLVVLADPSSQRDMPPSRRFWSVVWFSAGGLLCGAGAKPQYVDDSFCTDVGGLPNFPNVTELFGPMTWADDGYLWFLGNVPLHRVQ